MAATMVGKGLYDAAEIGWLLGHDADWVVRWSTTSGTGAAITSPSFDRLFSFADLVSLKVGVLVRKNGVSDRHLRHGVHTLRSWTDLERPLASHPVIRSLATSGSSFLSDLRTGEFEDIGQGGQGVFQEVIRLHLTKIAFNTDGEAERWIPAEDVVIDPAIQAGTPCVAGTRVPTATVASSLSVADVEDVAAEFDLPEAAVRHAEEFERRLAGGFGLAA